MMQFLKRLWSAFKGRRACGSELQADTVGDEERLARFIYESSKFSSQKCRAKPGAFLPDNRGETSICRTSNLTDADVWAIGDRIREIRSLARADFVALNATAHGLAIDAVPEDGYPQHAVIVGWPASKDEQKALALELANSLTLRIQG